VPLALGSIASGEFTTFGETDWYRVTLANVTSLRLETLGVTGTPCSVTGLDSRLELRSADGRLLATDNDDGPGTCSLIDGHGRAPRDAGAWDLPAGDYLVTVGGAGISPYRLAVFAE